MSELSEISVALFRVLHSIPAQAGIEWSTRDDWVPACAGMTWSWVPACASMTWSWVPACAGMTWKSHGGELHLLQSFFAIEAQTFMISRAFSLTLGRTNKSSSLETPLTFALVFKLVRYSFNNSRALPMR